MISTEPGSAPTDAASSEQPKISKARKESEKNRSKTNRDEFKSIIGELNRCLGDTKMSTNKCLSTAISVIKLGKFFNCKSLGAVMEDDDENCFMSSPEVLEELHSDIPIDLFMSTTNWIGIGFEETGKILYVSQGFKDSFKFDECIIGCQLQTICYNADEVLRRVFIEDKLSFLFHVKSQRRREKKVISIYIDGKLLEADDIKMFLGYGYGRAKMDSHDDIIIKNPMFLYSGCEAWISSDYQVIQGHPYLDMLVNLEVGSNSPNSSVDVFAYLHPDDIIALQKSQKMISKKGYSRGVCRVLTREKVRRYLYLAYKAYAYIKVESDTQIETFYVCYVWPFAYSSDTQSYIEGGMQFIDFNKLWDSKTPSFFKKSNNRIDLKSQGYKRKTFETSPTNTKAIKHTVAGNLPQVSLNKPAKVPLTIIPNPAEQITPQMIKQELLDSMFPTVLNLPKTVAQTIPSPMFVMSKPVSFAPVFENMELPHNPPQQQISHLQQQFELQQLQRIHQSLGPSPHSSPPNLHPPHSSPPNLHPPPHSPPNPQRNPVTSNTVNILDSLQQFEQQQRQKMHQQSPSPQHSPLPQRPHHSPTPKAPPSGLSEISRLRQLQQELQQQLLHQQQLLNQQPLQGKPPPTVDKNPTDNLLEAFRSTNPQLYSQLYNTLNKPQSLIKVLEILQSMNLLSKPA